MKSKQYNKVITYENLYAAYLNASNGKKKRSHVIQFQQTAPTRMLNLFNSLHNRAYKPKNDYRFQVYEPKKREIVANKFEDKIVQKLMCDDVLKHVVSPVLIYDNYASQPGKGTHIAIERLTSFLRAYFIQHGRDGYILQCDIKKYFDNINRETLVKMMEILPMDKNLVELLKRVIYHDHPENDSGICIGYQCSQWFAIYFLSYMDSLIKEELHIKYYGRYMDDFYLIHPDKEYLRKCKTEIEKLITKVGLTLNKKSDIYPIKNGITFLGYTQHLTKTGRVQVKIKRDSVARMKRRLRKYRKKFDAGEMEGWDIIRSYQAFHAHADHGNCDGYLNMIDQYFAEMFPELAEHVADGIRVDGRKVKSRTKGHGNSRIGKNIKILIDEDGFIKLQWTKAGADTYRTMFGKDLPS